jgi:hypothetical protein
VLSARRRAVKPQPRLIDGVKLQLKLPTLSATFRALLGHELQSGAVAITHYSPRQSAMVTESPMALIRAVGKATPLELFAMQGVLDIEAAHRQQLANKRRTDAVVDKILVEIGLDRVLAALERLTRPATNGAAVPTNGHDPAPAANDNAGNSGAAIPVHLAL